MKRLAKILGSIVAFVLIAVGAVLYFTADLVSSADSFFASVKADNLAGAYEQLSDGFKSEVSSDQLEAFLTRTGLREFESASWSSRSIENGVGKLSGVVTSQSGQSVPLTVTFLKERGAWKILRLDKPAAGISEAGPAQVPERKSLVTLVQGTQRAFGKAIDAGDMTSFHKFISTPWREQYTVEKLDEAYKSLYGMEANWESLGNLLPEFEATPNIDRQGVLNVEGHFKTQPDQLVFSHQYIQEQDEWRLLGLRINFRKGEGIKQSG